MRNLLLLLLRNLATRSPEDLRLEQPARTSQNELTGSYLIDVSLYDKCNLGCLLLAARQVTLLAEYWRALI
jgi:hypothetical protein